MLSSRCWLDYSEKLHKEDDYQCIRRGTRDLTAAIRILTCSMRPGKIKAPTSVGWHLSSWRMPGNSSNQCLRRRTIIRCPPKNSYSKRRHSLRSSHSTRMWWIEIIQFSSASIWLCGRLCGIVEQNRYCHLTVPNLRNVFAPGASPSLYYSAGPRKSSGVPGDPP